MGTDLLSTNLFMSRNLIVDCVDEFDLLLVGQGFVQTDLLDHFESGHGKEMDRLLIVSVRFRELQNTMKMSNKY